MTKLCPRGKAAAKRKFRVYPSAYANAYASKICAGKIKDPSGVKRKDFKGRKPAMGGGMMMQRPTMNKGGGADYMNTVKPRKRGNPPVLSKTKREKRMGGGMMKRASYMGGGLTEATARLKRQGLKAGSVARGCGAIMSDRKKKTRMV